MTEQLRWCRRWARIKTVLAVACAALAAVNLWLYLTVSPFWLLGAIAVTAIAYSLLTEAAALRRCADMHEWDDAYRELT